MPSPGEHLRLLAMLLAAPEVESLEVLRELAARHPWLSVPAAELDTLDLAEWQAEHGRLFICGHPHTPCVPFESAQRHGMMAGPSTEQLAVLYRGIGLQTEDLPPDYLGAMLECAAHLSEDDGNMDVESELWQEHLLHWLPGYAVRLQCESRLSLYRRLGTELASACRNHGGV
jgi:TorA maturation chaperone TorD